MVDQRISAADAITQAVTDGVSMRELARRMAGSRDYRKVENERTRLAKIVRENAGVMDQTAARLEDALALPRGSITRYQPGGHRESQKIQEIERRQESLAEAVAAHTRSIEQLAQELAEIRGQLERPGRGWQ